jgi:hypothetical protein
LFESVCSLTHAPAQRVKPALQLVAGVATNVMTICPFPDCVPCAIVTFVADASA